VANDPAPPNPKARPKRGRRIVLAAAATGVVLLAIFGAGLFRRSITVTGIVTTDEVIVSSEIQGRVQKLNVRQGDRVHKGDLLAVIAPAEWEADLDYSKGVEGGAAAQVAQAESDLDFEQQSTHSQEEQAVANLASARAQVKQSEADLEMSRLNLGRATQLHSKGTISQQDFDQARTTEDGAVAKADAMRKQAAAAEAALALARAGTIEVAARKAALESARQLLAADSAQTRKAAVELGYTELRAPIDGIVDLRAALQGEVVSPGTAVVTLVDPSDLWVRADVEETYIDRIRLGEKMMVRLPSGAEREGTVFFRGVDADYATQRDVSRTKRDIRTFEVRLRCDNRDERLALGMTAYVVFPFGR
jgi:multidrug resistance efflux pump